MLVIGLDSVSRSSRWFHTKSFQRYPMLLRRHLLPKTSICLFRSVFIVYVSQPWYSKTGITSDMKIRIFICLHRYWQRQILVLSEYITPWTRPIRCKTSWRDPPLFWTTLPRYLKLSKISMSSPHTWIDSTVSSSKPSNLRISPPRAVSRKSSSKPPILQQRLLHRRQKQGQWS